MLKAIPKSVFSWDFNIYAGNAFVAFLDLSWLREKGTIEIHGCTYEIGREGLMSGDFYLRSNGQTIAKASKPSAFRRSFEVRLEQATYLLAASSMFTRAFKLNQGGRVVGSIRPSGMFTRKATIQLPEEISLEAQVFITWLVIILWKRAHDSD